MFLSYPKLNEFLDAARAPVFVSNSIKYLPGREQGEIKARSTINLTTVLETAPIEVIGIISLTVEAPTFEAKFVEEYQPHFSDRNATARALVEQYIAGFYPELKCYSGFLSNNGLIAAIDNIPTAQQSVWELIVSAQGRAVRALPEWKAALSQRRVEASVSHENSALLDVILSEKMSLREGLN